MDHNSTLVTRNNRVRKTFALVSSASESVTRECRFRLLAEYPDIESLTNTQQKVNLKFAFAVWENP